MKNNLKIYNKDIKKFLTTAALVGSTTFLIGCGINKLENQEVEEIKSVTAEEVFGENLVINPDGTYSVLITETNLTTSTMKDNFDDFNSIEDVYEIEKDNMTEELKDEINDDFLSNYIIELQEINTDNPLANINMEEYFNENYDALLYSGEDFDEVKTAYSALAYQKLIDNNVDLKKAFEELNSIMVLQVNPTEMDEATYNETFKTLLSTLDEGETLYSIYFPLAKQLHLVTCIYDHELEYGITTCEDLENKYLSL